MKHSHLSDYLNPVLVKELKQELRSRTFTMLFVWGQAVLVLGVLIGIADGSRSYNELGTALFWIATGFPLLLIVPRFGIRSFYKETETKTLGLLLLSQITAWRLIFGKWLTYVLQASLYTIAVLPYLLVRYFHGGVNIFDDLWTLLILWILSAIATALTVGIAAGRDSRRQWGAAIFLTVFGLSSTWLMYFVSFLYSRMGLGGAAGGSNLLYFLIGEGSLWIALMLSFGAAKIAPPGENHALSIRLIGIAVLFSVPVLEFLGARIGPQHFLFIGFMPLLIVIGAFVESPRSLGSIYAPFMKFGKWSRVASLVLQPGWQSGVIYYLVMSALTVIILGSRPIGNLSTWRLLISLGGALLLTRLLVNWLFLPGLRHPLRAFITINLILILIHLVLFVIAPTAEYLTYFFPWSVFLLQFLNVKLNTGYFWITEWVAAGAFILLLPRVWKQLNESWRLQQEWEGERSKLAVEKGAQ